MRYVFLSSSNRQDIYGKLKNIKDFCLMNFFVLQYIIANDASFTSDRPSSTPYISFNPEIHRIFIFKSDNQYISFSFPYNYKRGKWYSMLNGRSFGSKEITPRICSHIITLLKKWESPFSLNHILYFEDYVDNGDSKEDWEYASAIIQSRIVIEGGYVRHDDDKSASINREKVHPQKHYDINYHEISKIKIGKYVMDSHQRFENFFVKDNDKLFLNDYHFSEKSVHSKDIRKSQRHSKRISMISPFRKHH